MMCFSCSPILGLLQDILSVETLTETKYFFSTYEIFGGRLIPLLDLYFRDEPFILRVHFSHKFL